MTPSNFAIAKVVALNPLCILFCISSSFLMALSLKLSLFLTLKGDSEKITVSCKSDNYMGCNTEKKPWTNLQNSYTNWSEEIKSDNFCYHKVGRAITKWGAIEKTQLLRQQYLKFEWFDRTIIISYFDGSNNIFADCSTKSDVFLFIISLSFHVVNKFNFKFTIHIFDSDFRGKFN